MFVGCNCCDGSSLSGLPQRPINLLLTSAPLALHRTVNMKCGECRCADALHPLDLMNCPDKSSAWRRGQKHDQILTFFSLLGMLRGRCFPHSVGSVRALRALRARGIYTIAVEAVVTPRGRRYPYVKTPN